MARTRFGRRAKQEAAEGSDPASDVVTAQGGAGDVLPDSIGVEQGQETAAEAQEELQDELDEATAENQVATPDIGDFASPVDNTDMWGREQESPDWLQGDPQGTATDSGQGGSTDDGSSEGASGTPFEDSGLETFAPSGGGEGVPDGTPVSGGGDEFREISEEYAVAWGYAGSPEEAAALSDGELAEMMNDAAEDQQAGLEPGPNNDAAVNEVIAGATDDANALTNEAADDYLDDRGYDSGSMSDAEKKEALDDLADKALTGEDDGQIDGGGSAGGDAGDDAKGDGSSSSDDSSSDDDDDSSSDDDSGDDDDSGSGDDDSGDDGDQSKGDDAGSDDGGDDDKGVDLTPDPDSAPLRLPTEAEFKARLAQAEGRRGNDVDPVEGDDPAYLDAAANPLAGRGGIVNPTLDGQPLPDEEALVQAIVEAGPPQGDVTDPSDEYGAGAGSVGLSDDLNDIDFTPGDDTVSIPGVTDDDTADLPDPFDNIIEAESILPDGSDGLIALDLTVEDAGAQDDLEDVAD